MLSSVVSLAEQELMFQVYRKQDREKIINLLKAENIPHKVVNEKQIYYPSSYKENVKKIKEKVWGPVDTSKKGARVSSKLAPTIAEELVKKGIPFSVNPDKRESFFTWQSRFDKEAMEIVRDNVK